jgi:hypothetical protein
MLLLFLLLASFKNSVNIHNKVKIELWHPTCSCHSSLSLPNPGQEPKKKRDRRRNRNTSSSTIYLPHQYRYGNSKSKIRIHDALLIWYSEQECKIPFRSLIHFACTVKNAVKRKRNLMYRNQVKVTIVLPIIFGTLGLFAILIAVMSLIWICVQRRSKHRADGQVEGVVLEGVDVKRDDGSG